MSDLSDITEVIARIDKKVSDLRASIAVAEKEAERAREEVEQLGLNPEDAKQEYKRLEEEKQQLQAQLEQYRNDAEEWLRNTDGEVSE